MIADLKRPHAWPETVHLGLFLECTSAPNVHCPPAWGHGGPHLNFALKCLFWHSRCDFGPKVSVLALALWCWPYNVPHSVILDLKCPHALPETGLFLECMSASSAWRSRVHVGLECMLSLGLWPSLNFGPKVSVLALETAWCLPPKRCKFVEREDTQHTLGCIEVSTELPNYYNIHCLLTGICENGEH